jgi:hypothetical protein
MADDPPWPARETAVAAIPRTSRIIGENVFFIGRTDRTARTDHAGFGEDNGPTVRAEPDITIRPVVPARRVVRVVPMAAVVTASRGLLPFAPNRSCGFEPPWDKPGQWQDAAATREGKSLWSPGRRGLTISRSGGIIGRPCSGPVE